MMSNQSKSERLEKQLKDLKVRVEQNENAWMKSEVQLNQLESRLLNQMAEYGKEIIRIQEQVTKIRRENRDGQS